MTRARAIVGSLAFLVVAPGTVAGAIPWWLSRWRVQRPFLGAVELRLLGAVLLVLGAAVLLDSFARFALLVWLAVHLFVVLYEEPTLATTFGDEYAAFRASVPRWLPRVRGWSGARRETASRASGARPVTHERGTPSDPRER